MSNLRLDPFYIIRSLSGRQNANALVRLRFDPNFFTLVQILSSSGYNKPFINQELLLCLLGDDSVASLNSLVLLLPDYEFLAQDDYLLQRILQELYKAVHCDPARAQLLAFLGYECISAFREKFNVISKQNCECFENLINGLSTEHFVECETVFAEISQSVGYFLVLGAHELLRNFEYVDILHLIPLVPDSLYECLVTLNEQFPQEAEKLYCTQLIQYFDFMSLFVSYIEQGNEYISILEENGELIDRIIMSNLVDSQDLLMILEEQETIRYLPSFGDQTSD